LQSLQKAINLIATELAIKFICKCECFKNFLDFPLQIEQISAIFLLNAKSPNVFETCQTKRRWYTLTQQRFTLKIRNEIDLNEERFRLSWGRSNRLIKNSS